LPFCESGPILGSQLLTRSESPSTSSTSHLTRLLNSYHKLYGTSHIPRSVIMSEPIPEAIPTSADPRSNRQVHQLLPLSNHHISKHFSQTRIARSSYPQGQRGRPSHHLRRSSPMYRAAAPVRAVESSTSTKQAGGASMSD
jgi:hypothetical protein